MKGTVIKDSNGDWFAQYTEDCFDGITVYKDHWTHKIPIRFIDIRQLIETDIIKENDIIDFEFVENKYFFYETIKTNHYYAKIKNYGSNRN